MNLDGGLLKFDRAMRRKIFMIPYAEIEACYMMDCYLVERLLMIKAMPLTSDLKDVMGLLAVNER